MNLYRTQNQVLWLPRETVLPMKSTQRDSKIGGILVAIFGLSWCAFLIASIIGGTVKEGANIPMTLLLLAFMLPGVLFLFMGLSLLISRKEVFLERGRVTVNENSLFKRERWTESLEDYKGVLKRFTYHAGGGTHGSGSSTVYEVVLFHDDPKKEICLFRSSRQSETVELWNQSWRRFGEMLERPMLEKDAEGIVAVGPDNRQDKKWDARTEIQAVAVSSTTVNLGRRIHICQMDHSWLFKYSHFWEAWKGALGLGVVTAMLFMGRLIQSQHPEESGIQVFFWLMWGFLGVMSLALLNYLTGVEELYIDKSRLRYRRKYLFRWTSPETISLDTIRNIAVKKNPQRPSRPSSIVIEGPSTIIRFGTGLPTSKKIGLKELLLSMLRWNERTEPSGSEGVGTRSRILVKNPGRMTHKKVLVMGLVLVGFFAVVASLMNIAFDSKPELATHAFRSEAEPQLKETGQTHRRTSADEDHRRNWISYYNAAEEAVRKGEYGLAEQGFRLAFKNAEKFREGDREKLSATAYYLGWVVEKQGRTDDAIAYLERSLHVKEEIGQGGLPLARNHLFMAKLLAKTGQGDRAEIHFREALSIADRHLSANQAELKTFVGAYQQFLSTSGREAEAETHISRSLGIN